MTTDLQYDLIPEPPESFPSNRASTRGETDSALKGRGPRSAPSFGTVARRGLLLHRKHPATIRCLFFPVVVREHSENKQERRVENN
jgi:hypothetical protein